ncbi:hypothetical protein IAU60_000871 [Kwoniella sp. DSM 27419]
MSRLATLSQRNPQSHPTSTPSPVLYPPNPNGSGPSSLRGTPSRPGSTASQYSESPFGGGMASSSFGPGSGYQTKMHSRDAHHVEGQNDERLDGLLGKVKLLKDITVGIGNEVRDSNVVLGNMNDSFSSTSNFLGGTFRRMNKMASRQGGNWCWFMGFLLLVLWIFIVVWWLRR